jgi:nucleoside-diphosphate-sugar epimerase
MRKVIVTGANGFVGSAVVKELLKNSIEVLAIVRNNHCDNLPNNDNLKVISLDIEKIIDLVDKVTVDQYDTFYHFAWIGSSGALRVDEKLQMQNALLTCDCLRVANQIGCKRFICAGSIMEKEVITAIYSQGSKPGLPYIYGAGKLMAHSLAKPIANSLGIDLVWTLISNAYGEGEVSPRFINTTLRKIIDKEPLRFTSAVQNYDFVHICDVARAFYLIGEKGKTNCEYLIGSSGAKPLKEFIKELHKTLAPETEIFFGDIPFTGVNMPLSVFDTSDTEKDTGFKAEISFAEGIKRTMDWIMEKEDKEDDSKI